MDEYRARWKTHIDRMQVGFHNKLYNTCQKVREIWEHLVRDGLIFETRTGDAPRNPWQKKKNGYLCVFYNEVYKLSCYLHHSQSSLLLCELCLLQSTTTNTFLKHHFVLFFFDLTDLWSVFHSDSISPSLFSWYLHCRLCLADVETIYLISTCLMLEWV